MCENGHIDLFMSVNSTFNHLVLSPLTQYKADLVRAFSEGVLPSFSNQTSSLRPVIDSTFDLEQIADAHRHMEANRNMGKIVIKVLSSPHLQSQPSIPTEVSGSCDSF